MTPYFTYGSLISSQLRAARETESGLILQYSVFGLFKINSFTTIKEGKIARLTDRGFAFISCEDEEKDIFFHSNELKDVEFKDLREGDKVSFEITESSKGLNAIKVSRV